MEGRKNSLKDRLSTAFMVLLLIIGTGLFLYPTIGDMYNRHIASVAERHEDQAVQALSEDDREEVLWKAQEYNRMVYENGLFRVSGMENDGYGDTLNVTGEGIMCSLNIPRIGIDLPVYHGTSEEVLQSAAGHYHGSSLPCGGEDTHCIITGHTGLTSAKLFTDLAKLREGDMFFIKVLGEVHAYRVISVATVLPYEMESLVIEPGRDLVTLVTCTPYGINTHRLLVTGERTRYERPDLARARAVSMDGYPLTFILIVSAVLIMAAVLMIIIIRRRYGKKV